MNKDVDERLVPKGEYRDAMNIQITTSEGSDVGTVQNILGNMSLTNSFVIPFSSRVVGSIADEKNDCFYWFVEHYLKNQILKYHNGNVIPIVVDLHPDNPDKKILEFPKTLSKKLITGINIIDDLLFWSDGMTEPKKINVKLCEQGTDVSGSYHTKLVVPKKNITAADNILLKKENITVIKKSPITPIMLDASYTKVVSSEIVNQNPFVDAAGDLLSVGSIAIADFDNFSNGSSYSVNEEVLLLHGNSGQLPTDFQVRVKVTEDISGGGGNNPGNPGGYSNVYKLEIMSISPGTPRIPGSSQNTMYKAQNVAKEELMFEKKLVRFSYRWKYQDGEYSTYAPFTSTVFLPGKFQYDTKSSFNKGMDKYLVGLNLRDFLPSNTPNDVVQVDILYKESNSTTVYIVDTVKPNDKPSISIGNGEEGYLLENFANANFNLFGTHSLNSWDANAYELESDVVVSAVGENQLLRPWDNVPRLAQAQEMSANRIIYGNYTQGFDIPEKPVLESKYITRYPDNLKYKPVFTNNYTETYTMTAEDISPSSDLFLYGQKSLKSMRDYQIGVTFLDKQGRETPVFSDTKSSFKIKKKHGRYKTAIQTRLKTDPPYWAEYMKFYVKETSNEYYNLVMDRVYDAKDGHYWLAFPSSEINKVKEDSYLILKKGLDSNDIISEEAKYKVIEISKSAPEYVKTKVINIGQSAGTETPSLTQSSPIVINGRSFEIDVDGWVDSGNSKLDEITDRLTLDFTSGAQSSKKYNIVTVNIATSGGINGGDTYKIVLDRIIDTADKWIYPNYPTVLDGSLPDTDPSLQINIYKNDISNRPEFDGRFFVKVYGDAIIEQYLLTSSTLQYEVNSRIDAYLIVDEEQDAGGNYNALHGTTTGFEKSNSEGDWTSNFDVSNPEDGVMDRIWFLDLAFYQATFTNSFNIGDALLGGDDQSGGYGRGIHQKDYGDGLKWYMDISYGQIYEDVDWNGTNSTSPTDGDNIPWDGTDENKTINKETVDKLSEDKLWQIGHPSNPFDAAQKSVVASLVEGSKFRFAGDTSEEIFTIDGPVTHMRRLNHTSWVSVENNFYNDWGGGFFPFSLNSNWDNEGYVLYKGSLRRYGLANNRRVTYRIPLDKDPNLSSIKPYSRNSTPAFDVADADTPFGIEFIEQKYINDQKIMSVNPAVWETEPRDSSQGLDIYYEASQAYPLKITSKNSQLYVPVGSVVTRPNGDGAVQENIVTRVTKVQGFNGIQEISLQFNNEISLAMTGINPNVPFRFTRPDGSFTTLYIAPLPVGPLPHFPGNAPYTYEFLTNVARNPIGLDWFNCFSFGNGVESNRIRDDFNQVTIDKGPVVSSTTDNKYEMEKRKSGLIFSGIYNSTTGVNNLNQFIMAEGITKDLNPHYGSIQKLFSRNNDLLAFCEDKVLRILANKDALFNADGNPQLLATNRVLGQTMPFAGEYGISKNPESFSADAYRMYFTDKARSAVLRLSMDGITLISDYGMSDWFSDNLRNNDLIIGSYDTDKGDYNITLPDTATTVSFDDGVNGWSSFKSFVTDFGALSLGSDYYTFKKGSGYKHHIEVDTQGNTNPRNTFYGTYTPSSVSAVLNDEPGTIKSFKTLNYEGSQSYVNIEATDIRTGFYNLIQKNGWSTEYISTDKQTGTVSEFMEKEGKWFNYIKGVDVAESLKIKTDEFSFQGIGKTQINGVSVDTTLYINEPTQPVGGCMDVLATNYNPNANFDDGSCVYFQQVPGCTDPNATNYNSSATYDDGSCVIGTLGCTDPRADNYDPLATVDDGSCILAPPIYGCTNPNASNYDSTATVDNGSCIIGGPIIYGCTDPLALNYNPGATVDDGSCVYGPTDPDPTPDVYGCADPLALNYDPLVTVDDGSCTYTPNSLTIEDINDMDTDPGPLPDEDPVS